MYSKNGREMEQLLEVKRAVEDLYYVYWRSK